jgi:hypothetical protein
MRVEADDVDVCLYRRGMKATRNDVMHHGALTLGRFEAVQSLTYLPETFWFCTTTKASPICLAR